MRDYSTGNNKMMAAAACAPVMPASRSSTRTPAPVAAVNNSAVRKVDRPSGKFAVTVTEGDREAHREFRMAQKAMAESAARGSR